MFPINIIYQKYYDPLIFILIFTLIDSKYVYELFKVKFKDFSYSWILSIFFNRK